MNITLTQDEQQNFLATLKIRFEGNLQRHPGIQWEDIHARLESNPAAVKSLYAMEKTEGEPDVIGYDDATKQYIFCDCSPESPKERRSLCYDQAALDARKANKPLGSAVEMARSMGVELLTEREYLDLQKLGDFDLKTSSWLKTPETIRKHGGAIFGDKRYQHAFIYHNGAESYYAARGFRAILRV